MKVEVPNLCAPLDAIKTLIENNAILKLIDPNKKVLKAIWPSEATQFCSSDHSGALKFSVGFKGFYPDPRESYDRWGTHNTIANSFQSYQFFVSQLFRSQHCKSLI